MEQSPSPNQSPASSPTDGTHSSSSSASSRPSSHLTVRPAASPVNHIRLINDHSPNDSNTPNALSPNHQLEAGEIEQAEAIQPPDTSSHHNEVLRAAANQILHSARGSGNTLSSLVSALAKPWIDVDNFSESESSSDESPDQSGNDGVRGSPGAETPVADEDFSDESHDESDEEDFEALQRKRRGMNAKKLGAALNNSQEEESTLLAARNRFPSYAHLFPQTAEDEMPIESYGIIGNCLTTALISTDATIAWYCYPHHDSPSIFHSLLDHTKGGSFKITPAREATHATVTTKQLYHTETNVLLTRFFTDSGVGHVTDYMPMGDRSKEHNAGQWLVRELEVVRGRMYFNVECTPTFDYGRASHTVTVLPAGALFESSSLSMLLTSSKNRVWKQTANGGVKTKVTLQEGQRVIFVLREWKADVEKEAWLKKKKEEELLERQKHFIEEQLQQHFDLTTTSAGSVILSPSLSSRALTSQSSKHNSPRMPRLNLASSPTTPTVGTGTPSSSSHRTHDGSTFGLHTIQPIKHRIMDKLRKETMQYWRDWISNSSYEGRWREVMRRSVLMIKLLTFAPTGAIIQSPTCGLPTTIGVAGRDLRYVNLRDATLAATALLRLGFRTESAQFMSWLVDRCKETQRKDGRVEMIYTIWGSTDIPRFTLPDVEGFKHSRPVEVGKVNSGHFCFDVYGSVLNAIYLSNIYTEPISWEFWQVTRKLIDYVCAHWDEPDDGIWDFDDRKSDETNRRHFTISKMMCWVCLDRGIKLAHERSFPAPFHAWKRTRDEIYASVQEKGFNKKTNTYVQSYDSAQVDAALLLMPVMGFSSPSDPKFLSTLHFILRPILAGGLTSNGLIHQTIPESESDQNERMFGVTQSTCSFWAIEACTRAGLADRHYLDRARLLMEQMLGYGNHLGLYSEYLGLRGDHLGSYPHLLTHVCLIRSAAYLDLALAQQKPHHVVTAMTDDFPTAKMQAQPQKHPLEEGQASGNY